MQSRVCPGIINAGNTCFFSAIIQMLTNTNVPFFVAEYLKRHPNDVLNLLNTIFQHLLSGQDVKKSLVIEIFSYFPNYDVSQQSDAHEFLIYLLSILGLNNNSMFSFSLNNYYLCSHCNFISG